MSTKFTLVLLEVEQTAVEMKPTESDFYFQKWARPLMTSHNLNEENM